MRTAAAINANLALARIDRASRMNKTEVSYALELTMRKRVGAIRDYAFESHKLRLADNTYYTPDFMVILSNREIEFHEVKGWWRDDARAKIKVAAEQFPMYRFRAIQARPKKDGGGWIEETFR